MNTINNTDDEQKDEVKRKIFRNFARNFIFMRKTDYEKLSDSTLTELLCQGDIDAFAAIFRRHHAQLYRHAAYYLKDNDSAADVVQDVFLKLWTIKEGLDEGSTISALLYTMTHNQVLNYIRSRNRRITHNYVYSQQEALTEGEEDAIWKVMEQETKEKHLLSAIDNLSGQQKLVMMLRYSGYSNKDIAEITGLSLNTIKTHYSQSLKRLRNILAMVKAIIVFFII